MSAADPGTWLIYGCRSPYTVEVLEILWRCGHDAAALVDNLPDGPVASSLGRVSTPDGLEDPDLARPVVIPLLTPGFRWTVEAEARSYGLAKFPSVVDPSAVVARTTTLAEGTVVNMQAAVGGNSRLGRFVHVNRSASLAHDLLVEGYVTFGPGCTISGGVRIGRGAFVGAGAVCAPGVTIGANAIVGAGAVVLHDVEADAVVVGNPAREIRRGGGYGGVKVPQVSP